VGKTHLSIALGVKGVEGGHKVLSVALEAMITRLKRAYMENRIKRQVQATCLSLPAYNPCLLQEGMRWDIYLPMSHEEGGPFF